MTFIYSRCLIACLVLLVLPLILFAGPKHRVHGSQDSTSQEPEFSFSTQVDSLEKANDDMETRASIENSLTKIAQEEYYRESFIHRKNTFQWQYETGKIIFAVVILIVICGTVFSGMQFYQSLKEVHLKEKFYQRSLANNTAPEAVPEISDNKTDIELSSSGVKVSSSLVGILVLIISIVFFYLYLIYVYPINTLNVDTQVPKVETAKSVK